MLKVIQEPGFEPGCLVPRPMPLTILQPPKCKEVLKSLGFPGGSVIKESACQCKTHEIWVRSQGWKDPLEEEMATHSSILAWEIP